MGHLGPPPAEQRTAEIDQLPDAYFGGNPWSRTMRVKDCSAELNLPGGDLLLTPWTSQFDRVGTEGWSLLTDGLGCPSTGDEMER